MGEKRVFMSAVGSLFPGLIIGILIAMYFHEDKNYLQREKIVDSSQKIPLRVNEIISNIPITKETKVDTATPSCPAGVAYSMNDGLACIFGQPAGLIEFATKNVFNEFSTLFSKDFIFAVLLDARKTLLSTNIGLLENLQFIVFRGSFYGVIPSEMGLCQKLVYLQLDSNDISSTIPSELGQLTLLTSLTLRQSQLSGTIPSEIFILTNIIDLRFDANTIGGLIPSEIGNLTGLTNLELQFNQFTSIPSQIYLLTNIKILLLSNNNIQSSVSSLLGKLTNLNQLALFSNKFHGVLPSQIGKLTASTLLSITDNSFSSSLPSEIGNLSILDHLEIAYNKFRGTIPVEFNKLTKLNHFVTMENFFEGNHPSGLPRTECTNSGLSDCPSLCQHCASYDIRIGRCTIHQREEICVDGYPVLISIPVYALIVFGILQILIPSELSWRALISPQVATSTFGTLGLATHILFGISNTDWIRVVSLLFASLLVFVSFLYSLHTYLSLKDKNKKILSDFWERSKSSKIYFPLALVFCTLNISALSSVTNISNRSLRARIDANALLIILVENLIQFGLQIYVVINLSVDLTVLASVFFTLSSILIKIISVVIRHIISSDRYQRFRKASAII
eukprot:c20804_g1_i2.p1 GENE.c20804_g1_i2~~c20804_g1_i2.p1  ORF type:complete len:621 (+),score=138.20 c20804_g1_i2:28-1890(+)